MNKTIKRNIVISAVTAIALCVSLIAGATFALFTSESKVNVAVTSGKVSVVATVNTDSVQTKKLYDEAYSSGSNNMFEATVDFSEDGSSLTVTNMVLGDGIKFDIGVENNSNITVKYRTVIACEVDDGLFEGLTVTVGGVAYDGGTKISAYSELAAGAPVASVPVVIELPETAGNEYQAKTFKFVYSVEAVQGNADVSDPESGVYYAYTANDLRLLASRVNAGESFAGKKVVLLSDIDLGGTTWTPIGKDGAPFCGEFDGGNHTVYNLTVGSAGTSNVGFFGFTKEGEVKNLKFHNATVIGRLSVGVVAGTPYTTEYSGITVSGLVKVDGYAYVGGAFGKNAYDDLTDITINVEEGSYVKADSEAYRTYVGGVVGFMGEGSHVVKNVTSNINVSGSTCDVGGITGIAHYGNSFINCSSSGNVTILNEATGSDVLDSLEIGGIAGVWMNSASGNVTFTNCSFTGTLTNQNGNDLSGNIITGAAYDRNGLYTDNLIIN